VLGKGRWRWARLASVLMSARGVDLGEPARFEWPVLRQLRTRDLQAFSETSISADTRRLAPRTKRADRVVKSICPYCAVGCGQNIYVDKGVITNIEGDPDSPISRGRLCPKGAATYELVTGRHRQDQVLYRKPYGTEWEPISLERAMDMVAERVKQTRENTWEDKTKQGRPLRRTMGFAHLGGATLDNEENYLIKKLFTALGAVQIENQARI
jgi:formate dehydrogenase major subunit